MHYTDSRNPSYDASAGGWPFSGSVPPPPSNPCLSSDPGDATATIPEDGKILNGFSVCIQQRSSDGSGAMVSCKRVATVDAPPTVNANGNWTTLVTLAASDSLCGSDAPSGWAKADGSAASGTPAPPKPTGNSTPAPKICGGGSCYDPNSDEYCAVAGGQQFCVSGASARSSAGGCSSSGDATLCAGAPNAPAPPNPPIPDPPTDIRNSDTTTQANPNTGATTNVTTNVFAAPGTSTSSGQQAGDSGPANGGQPSTGGSPAHSSSAGGNGTLSGGGDCNSPPICTGDAVLCGQARVQWATTCEVHRDLAGTEPVPTSTVYDGSSLWTAPGSSGDPVADAAAKGNFDTSGYGAGTACPMKDLTVTFNGQSFDVPLSEGCVIGPWIRAIVIGFAFFYAGMIVVKGGD